MKPSSKEIIFPAHTCAQLSIEIEDMNMPRSDYPCASREVVRLHNEDTGMELSHGTCTNPKENDTLMENIFDNPAYFREIILKQKYLIKYNKNDYLGKSLICVFFTSYCGVGCPFCFFQSPSPKKTEDNIQNIFTKEGLEKFIDFANKANLGYLQISGGGEPFLEKEAILKSIEEINADRIILVTGGMWAYDKNKAEQYLSDIEKSIAKRKTKTRISIRLSISSNHSIKLEHYPLLNLLQIFENKYRDNDDFSLQLKIFDGDDVLEKYLKQYFKNYKLEYCGKNESDDIHMIKVMPWRLKLTLISGYQVVVGKSRVFEPSLRPNLLNRDSIKRTIKIYNQDIKQSQKDFPSIVFDSDGRRGLDWIIEFNGNVCTWQNRIQDNLLNIYEDNYDNVFDNTIQDLITLSFIEKGATYREKIISEISPKTVSLMKAVSIRDYAGTLLFEDEKIRLYYNLRVLQDYISENRVNELALSKLPSTIQNILKLDRGEIRKLYKKSSYSIFNQELKKDQDSVKFKDFLELVKLGHYEMSDKQIQEAIEHYSKINAIDAIDSLDDIKHEIGVDIERRLTRRVLSIKRLKRFNKTSNDISKYVYIFRHGETDWNVEKRIKGQLEDAPTFFTEKGIEQIKNLVKVFKDKTIDAIFASDLMRARDMALMLREELNIPISFHKELRGFNMGKYQGFLFDDFIKEKEVIEAIRDHNKPIPEGESINQLINRLVSFINKIVIEYPYKKIAIITHGAAISNLKASISEENYIDIDRCVLLYENNICKVIESGLYSA